MMRQKTKDSHAKRSQGQKITFTLSSLFKRIHQYNDADSGSAIAPQGIVKALPSIGTCGSRNGYKFRPGRQEDAHEFLVHLLDAMHDGELRAAGINQQISGWRDRLPVARLDETTFIHRIFGGYFRSQIRCGKCGYRSNTYDPFLDLSLEVSKKPSRSIFHSLSDFTRKETLDSDNQWKCSGCKKYVCATKQLTVFRPPLSLCVQLKRFTFDGGFGGRGFSAYGTGGWKYGKKNNKFGGGGSGKIAKPIEFPAELKLPLSDNRSCEYALTGIVIHVGGSASSGHYTAYVKKPGRKGKSQWYYVDDSFVEPVSEKTVLKQKDAYLLFYCRKEVKLEFPSPPPRGMSADEAMKVGRARAKAKAGSSASKEEQKQQQEMSKDDEKKPSAKSIIRSEKTSLERTKTKLHPLASPQPKSNATKSAKLQSQPTAQPRPLDQFNKSSSSDDSSESDPSNSTKPAAKSNQVEENDVDSDFDPEKVVSSSDSESESEAKSPMKVAKKQDESSFGSTSDSSSSDEEDDSKKVKQKPNSDSTSKAVRQKTASKEESSSTSSSGEESSSDSDSDSDKQSANNQAVPEQQKSTESKVPSSNRTRVVVGNKDARGKIHVMLGPRKKKLWKTKAAISAKGAEFDLLGTMASSKWGDEEPVKSSERKDASQERGRIVEKMNKQEKSRKRKHHLGRWDTILDQGRTKKTKKDKEANQKLHAATSTKNNVFQRIQSGVQRMNKGKAKGFFRGGGGGKKRGRPAF